MVNKSIRKIQFPKPNDEAIAVSVSPKERIALTSSGVPLTSDAVKVDILGQDIILTEAETGSQIVMLSMALMAFDDAIKPIIEVDGEALNDRQFIGRIGEVGNLSVQDYIAISSILPSERHDSSNSYDGESIDDVGRGETTDPGAGDSPNVGEGANPTNAISVVVTPSNDRAQFDTQFEKPFTTDIEIELRSNSPRNAVDAEGDTFVSIAETSSSSSSAIPEEPDPAIFDLPPEPVEPPQYEVNLYHSGVRSGMEDADNDPGTPDTMVVRGGGGSESATFNGDNDIQFQNETLNFQDAVNDLTLYADDPLRYGSTGDFMTRNFAVQPLLASGFRITSISLGNLPAGFEVVNIPADGNAYTAIDPVFNDQGELIFELRYPTPQYLTFELELTIEAFFDEVLYLQQNPDEQLVYPQEPVITIEDEIFFEIKDAFSADDLSYDNADGDRVHVLTNLPNENIILSGSGNDTIYGGAGDTEVRSGDGNDTLIMGEGNDTLDGGKGDDIFKPGSGVNQIIGGEGNDTVDYSDLDTIIEVDLGAATFGDFSQLLINGGSSNSGGFENYLKEVENITTGGKDDVLRGNDASNIINSGGGNDALQASEGADFLDGQAGFDTLDYSTLLGADIHVDLANGWDQAGPNADGYVTTAVLDLLNPTDTTTKDFIKNIENITGGSGHDILHGDSNNNILIGNAGNDAIFGGGGGTNTLIGGTDTFTGTFIGTGLPAVYAPSTIGGDTVDYGAINRAVTVTLDTGSGIGLGHDSGLTFTDTITEVENIIGSHFADDLAGSRAANHIDGGLGDDVIATREGNDIINAGYTHNHATRSAVGATDDDKIYGGQGDDLIIAGYGNDRLDGGTGGETAGGDIVDYRLLSNADLGLDGIADNFITATLTDRNGSIVFSDHVTAGSDTFTDTVLNIETVVGTAGSDRLEYTGGLTFTAYGDAGEDYLSAALSTAAVIFYGGVDNDTLIGGRGDDILYGDDGDDVLRGGEGIDSYYGGLGQNMVDFSGGIYGAIVTLSGSGFVTNDGHGNSGETLDLIQHLFGTSEADFFFGNLFDNHLYGQAGDDELSGDIGNDRLYGGDDNDLLFGGQGSDRLDGGSNTAFGDTVSYNEDVKFGVVVDLSTATALNGWEGIATNDGFKTIDTLVNIENIIGSKLDDIITGNALDNQLFGGKDDDIIYGGGGNDEIDGGDDDDQLYGGSGQDEIDGGDGDDEIDGGLDTDDIDAGDGDDIIFASAGDDEVDGGDGKDQMDFSAFTMNTRLVLALDASSKTSAILYDTHGTPHDLTDDTVLYTQTIRKIENVIGTAGHDDIKGDREANIIDAGDGDDHIHGSEGGDDLTGGAGNDTLYYTSLSGLPTDGIQLDLTAQTALHIKDGTKDFFSGFEVFHASHQDDRILTSSGVDDVYAQGGDDLFFASYEGDNFHGGSGSDTVNYAFIDTSGVAIRVVLQDMGSSSLTYTDALDASQTFTDTLTEIENIIGTTGDDWLEGNTADNALEGNSGADTLIGHDGKDSINGGDGQDTLSGGRGDDTIYGGSENDRVSGGDGQDKLHGGDGAGDTLDFSDVTTSHQSVVVNLNGIQSVTEDGYGQADLEVSGFENVIASANNDTIHTTDNRGNIIWGEDGSDIIYGSTGADMLHGKKSGSSDISTDTLTYETLANVGVHLDLRASVQQATFLRNGTQDFGLQQTDFDGFDEYFTTGQNDIIITSAGADVVNALAGSDTMDYSNLASGGSITVILDAARAVTVNVNDGSAGANNDLITGIENIIGTNGADTITGDIESNTLTGNGGVDKLTGHAGNDFLYGGAGDDILDGGSDIDRIEGGDDHDTIYGGKGDDTLYGDKGDDEIWGGADSDTLHGGDGHDILNFNDLTTSVTLNLNTQTAMDGNSSIDSFSAFEEYVLTRFNDTVIVENSAAKIDGHGAIGTDSDTIDFSFVSTTGMTAGLDLTLDRDLFTTATVNGVHHAEIKNIENITATHLDDTLTGDSLNNTFYGLRGNDILSGEAGDDQLYGGDGDDTLNGGSGFDSIDGGADDDIIIASTGGDDIDGGLGAGDWLDFSQHGGISSGVTITLNGGTKSTIFVDNVQDGSLKNIEHIKGSTQKDTLTGDAGDNILQGHDNDDVLAGRGGNDTLNGGQGRDTAHYGLSNNAVIANLSAGVGTVVGTSERDTLISIENLEGSHYNDILIGDNTVNWITGGSQTVNGRAVSGDDLIYATEGADIYNGEEGSDTVDYSGNNNLDTNSDKHYTPHSAITAIDVTLDAARDSILTVTYASGATDTHTLRNIENITGSQGADELHGDTNDNILRAEGGDDTLSGGQGIDTIDGGTTHETDGDTVTYATSTAGIIVDLSNSEASRDGFGSRDILLNIENVIGSDNDDEITGDSGDNIIQAGADDDTVYYSGGIDTIDGGTDTVFGDTIDFSTVSGLSGVSPAGLVLTLDGAAPASVQINGTRQGTVENIENIVGTDYVDVLGGDSRNNTITAGMGDDILITSTGNDTLDGGDGLNDWIDFSGRSDITHGLTLTLNTSSPSDVLIGQAAGPNTKNGTVANVENIIGSNTSDTLTGDYLDNEILAGDGNDTLIGGGGADILDGGSQIDTADYSSSYSSVGINLSLSAAQAYDDGAGSTDTLISIETLIGSNNSRGGFDILTGDSNANTLIGGRVGVDIGDDLFYATRGSDVYDGVGGVNTVDYSGTNTGNDAYAESSAITRLAVKLENSGDSTATLSYSASSGFTADTHILRNIQNITGSQHGDDILGNNVHNILDGQSGDDIIGGGGDRDTLYGGEGDDTLDGGEGNDFIYGGNFTADTSVNDTISYASAVAGVDLDLQANTAYDDGFGTSDQIFGIEHITGSDQNDRLLGNGDDNIILGGDGDDTLAGRGGQDIVDGQSGLDDRVTYEHAAAGVTVNLGVNGQGDGVTSDDGDGSWDVVKNIEHITGSTFADRLIGDASDNEISGGKNDDILSGGAGIDILDGGDDNDTADYTDASLSVEASLTTHLAHQDGSGSQDTLRNIENLIGSRQNDTLSGDFNVNILEGGSGDDTISGYAGHDKLYGGLKNGTDLSVDDTLDYSYLSASDSGIDVNLATERADDGQGGTDEIYGFEHVTGSLHNDTFHGVYGENNTFHGGQNDLDSDTADYSHYTPGQGGIQAVLGHLATVGMVTDIGSPAFSDTLIKIENIIGTHSNDTLIASEGHNTLLGLGGDDIIQGNGGINTYRGGALDMLTDTSVNDTLRFDTLSARVELDIEAGTVVYTGDTSTHHGFEIFYATAEDDKIWAGSGSGDRIFAGAHDDELFANIGDDFIDGGAHQSTGSKRDSIDYYHTQLTSQFSSLDLPTLALDLDLSTNTAKVSVNGALIFTDTLSNIENVFATENADMLKGDANDNTLTGRGGDDTFIATLGDDQYDGGDGLNDTVDYSSLSNVSISISLKDSAFSAVSTIGDGDDQLKDIEHVIATNGSDFLRGNSSNNIFNGLGNDDVFYGSDGFDIFYGGTGYNTVDYSSTNSTIADLAYVIAELSSDPNVKGIAHAHKADGSLLKSDDLYGIQIARLTKGNDIIYGDDGYNEVEADDGDDTFYSSLGSDRLDGGDGARDKIDYSNNAAISSIVIDLTTAVDQAKISYTGRSDDTQTLIAIEDIVGTAGNDWIRGSSVGNIIQAGAGNDLINVDRGTGNIADGGTDTNTLKMENSSGQGYIIDMSIVNNGYFSFRSMDLKADVSRTSSGETVIGSSDYGAIISAMSAADYQIFVQQTNKTTGTATNFRDIIGSTQADWIVGDGQDNIIWGRSGADTIYGGGGDDTIEGEQDFGFLYGQTGNDIINGGANNDYIEGGDGDDIIEAGSGHDTIYGDNQSGSGVNDGNDTIQAGDGNDIIYTGGGAWNIVDTGAGEFNYVYTGSGDDTVIGHAGEDKIIASFGNDHYTVGTNSGWQGDSISYTDVANISTITTYFDSVTQDKKIDLFALDGRTSTHTIVGYVQAISATDNADTLNNLGQFVYGRHGNDTFIITDMKSYRSSLIGGYGSSTTLERPGDIDTIDFSGSGQSINAQFRNPFSEGYSLGSNLFAREIEVIIGSSKNDNFLTGDVLQTVYGGAGNDKFDALTSGVTLMGEADNDTFTLTKHNISTTIDGGNDFDILDYSDSTFNGQHGISTNLSALSGGSFTIHTVDNGVIAATDTVKNIELLKGTSNANHGDFFQVDINQLSGLPQIDGVNGLANDTLKLTGSLSSLTDADALSGHFSNIDILDLTALSIGAADDFLITTTDIKALNRDGNLPGQELTAIVDAYDDLSFTSGARFNIINGHTRTFEWNDTTLHIEIDSLKTTAGNDLLEIDTSYFENLAGTFFNSKVDGGSGTDKLNIHGDIQSGFEGDDLAKIFTDIEEIDFTHTSGNVTFADGQFDISESDVTDITGGSNTLTLQVNDLSDISGLGADRSELSLSNDERTYYWNNDSIQLVVQVA